MKRIFYIVFALLLLVGCETEDDAIFDINMSSEELEFTPIAGGAIMKYNLPSNSEVLYIKVRYTDPRGKLIERTGSYADNTIELLGFDYAQKAEAEVSLMNRDKIESSATMVSFETLDSGPVEFLKKTVVRPAWSGFTVDYSALSEHAKGIAHIYYVGISPETNQIDTIPLRSVIFDGADMPIIFPTAEDIKSNTVVIRTEDLRGYIVDRVVYENIEAYEKVKLPSENIKFIDPHGLSVEDEDYQLGVKYLFDGDTKGYEVIDGGMGKDGIYSTFLAGPNAYEKPFILDLGKESIISGINIYAIIKFRYWPPAPSLFGSSSVYGSVWRGAYENKLPASFTIYASNNMDDESSWVEIIKIEDDPMTIHADRWCKEASGNLLQNGVYKTNEELDSADPGVLQVDFPLPISEYRYLKLIVHDTYRNLRYTGSGASEYMQNTYSYISLHELEVYTNK